MDDGAPQPESVEDLIAMLVKSGQAHLERLGLQGAVVVNVAWSDDVADMWAAAGSHIPADVPEILAQSLRQSAQDVDDAQQSAAESHCEMAGHDWQDAGGGMEICSVYEAERWSDPV